MHLSGGDFDVIGLSLPGVPLIVVGHNRNVAWGITFAYIDTQDLFLEKMDPDQPGRYLYKGQWQSAERIEESIGVKGNDAPVTHEILQTIHGPILSTPVAATGRIEHALTLRWSAHDGGSMLAPLIRMTQAQDLTQFKAAALEWTEPAINLVSADRQGNIGYVLGSRIPIRPQGHGTGPFPGWDSQYDWQGYVPGTQKPWHLNPEEGFVATANNRVVPKDYPHYLSDDFLAPFRADRIKQVLSGKDKVSQDDFKTLQGDYQCLPAGQFIKALSRIEVNSPEAKTLIARLQSWDQDLGSESTGGAIYVVLFQKRHPRKKPAGNQRALKAKDGRRSQQLALGPPAQDRISAPPGPGQTTQLSV